VFDSNDSKEVVSRTIFCFLIHADLYQDEDTGTNILGHRAGQTTAPERSAGKKEP
jgi:hypothetical protein